MSFLKPSQITQQTTSIVFDLSCLPLEQYEEPNNARFVTYSTTDLHLLPMNAGEIIVFETNFRRELAIQTFGNIGDSSILNIVYDALDVTFSYEDVPDSADKILRRVEIGPTAFINWRILSGSGYIPLIFSFFVFDNTDDSFQETTFYTKQYGFIPVATA